MRKLPDTQGSGRRGCSSRLCVARRAWWARYLYLRDGERRILQLREAVGRLGGVVIHRASRLHLHVRQLMLLLLRLYPRLRVRQLMLLLLRLYPAEQRQQRRRLARVQREPRPLQLRVLLAREEAPPGSGISTGSLKFKLGLGLGRVFQ